MDTKFYKSEKFQKILYSILYLIIAFAFIASGCFIFYRTYYSNVYVSGSSMSPTLMGGDFGQRYHYGISDNHEKTLKNLNRFDVVITYYPSSWVGSDEDTTYKIKRVWGFPGETISMSYNEVEGYVFEASKEDKVIYRTTATLSEKTYENLGSLMVATFSDGRRTFDVNACKKNVYPSINGYGEPLRYNYTVTLSEENREYFLMGDNWTNSSDSYSHLGKSDKIQFDNLQGKVVSIKGTANIVNGELVDKKPIKNMYYF